MWIILKKAEAERIRLNMADSESGVGLMSEVLDAALVREEASMAKTPWSSENPEYRMQVVSLSPYH
jgi:hypothetical protein